MNTQQQILSLLTLDTGHTPTWLALNAGLTAHEAEAALALLEHKQIAREWNGKWFLAEEVEAA